MASNTLMIRSSDLAAEVTASISKLIANTEAEAARARATSKQDAEALATIKRLQEANQAQTEELKSLTAKCDSLQRDADARVGSAEDDARRTKVELQAAMSAIDKLKGELEAAKLATKPPATSGVQSSNVTDAAACAPDLLALVAAVKRQMEWATSTAADSSQQLAAIETTVAAIRSDHDATRTLADDAAAALAKLRALVVVQEEQLREARGRAAAAAKAAEEARAAACAAAAQRDQLQEAIHHKDILLTAAQEQAKASESSLAKRSELLAHTNESLGMQEATLQRLRGDITQLRKQVEMHYEEMRVLRVDHAAELEDSLRAVAAAEAAAAEAKAEASRLQHQLADAQRKLADKEADITALQQQCTSAQFKLAELEAAAAAASGKGADPADASKEGAGEEVNVLTPTGKHAAVHDADVSTNTELDKGMMVSPADGHVKVKRQEPDQRVVEAAEEEAADAPPVPPFTAARAALPMPITEDAATVEAILALTAPYDMASASVSGGADVGGVSAELTPTTTITINSATSGGGAGGRPRGGRSTKGVLTSVGARDSASSKLQYTPTAAADAPSGLSVPAPALPHAGVKRSRSSGDATAGSATSGDEVDASPDAGVAHGSARSSARGSAAASK